MKPPAYEQACNQVNRPLAPILNIKLSGSQSYVAKHYLKGTPIQASIIRVHSKNALSCLSSMHLKLKHDALSGIQATHKPFVQFVAHYTILIRS